MTLPVPLSAWSFPDFGAVTAPPYSPRLAHYHAHTAAPVAPRLTALLISVGVGASSLSAPFYSVATVATVALITASPHCRVLSSKAFPFADASQNSAFNSPADAGFLHSPHRSLNPTGQYFYPMSLASPSGEEQSFTQTRRSQFPNDRNASTKRMQATARLASVVSFIRVSSVSNQRLMT